MTITIRINNKVIHIIAQVQITAYYTRPPLFEARPQSFRIQSDQVLATVAVDSIVVQLAEEGVSIGGQL